MLAFKTDLSTSGKKIVTCASAFYKHIMFVSAGQLKAGDLVGIRDGNLVKFVDVQEVEHTLHWVTTAPTIKWGPKYLQRVPQRMPNFADWVRAGRPYVNKIRQNRIVTRNSYPLSKTSYKVQGKWRTVPTLTPVCVHD